RRGSRLPAQGQRRPGGMTMTTRNSSSDPAAGADQASSAAEQKAGQMVNAFDPATAGDLPEADRDLIARREAALGAAYRLFYAHPLHLVRAEGCWMWDAEGRRYLDAYNNVACVGHSHPR